MEYVFWFLAGVIGYKIGNKLWKKILDSDYMRWTKIGR